MIDLRIDFELRLGYQTTLGRMTATALSRVSIAKIYYNGEFDPGSG